MPLKLLNDSGKNVLSSIYKTNESRNKMKNIELGI